MLLGLASLLLGMWAGLGRMEWGLPGEGMRAEILHGPLMVSGFLGTLISLERATALGRPWGYAAPVLSGAGALGMAAGLIPGRAAIALLAAAGAMLLGMLARIHRRHPGVAGLLHLLGAASWLAGNALWWSRWAIHEVVFLWAGLPVVTIAAERVELSRILAPPAWIRRVLLLLAAALPAGAALVRVSLGLGVRLWGAALLGLAAALFFCDLARRTVRSTGLPRYIALAVLSGYAWLAAGGALALLHGEGIGGAAYGVTLHAVFLGFVMPMIFAHAPVILPAVGGVAVAFDRLFYAPLLLLHASLLVRSAGSLLVEEPLRRWGGLLNVAAVLLFFGVLARGVRRARPPRAA